MNRIRHFLPLTGILFLLSVPLFALTVPKAADGYVTDKAGILSPQFRSALERTLAAYDQKTSTQILVAIFPSLEGDSLEDFSIRLAEAWKPGQKGHDNGVILLVIPNDRKVRIEVGYGLEGHIPDALAGQIIQAQILPAFRQGNYEKGIALGVKSVMELAEGLEVSGISRKPVSDADGAQVFKVVFILIGIAAVVLSIFDLFRYHGYWNDHRLYTERYSFTEWWIRFSLLLACLGILMRILLNAALSSGGRGGSGGSGGFSGGGGSFGGGGASGSW